MYSKSKKLKSLVFLTSLAVVASMTTLSGFASGPSSDGTSSASSNPSSTHLDVPVPHLDVPVPHLDVPLPDSASSDPKYIYLDGPGNYSLFGVDCKDATNTDRHFTGNGQDMKYIPVYSNSKIVIKGSGEYNITMKNVYIYLSDIPLMVESNADVTLTLVGYNILQSSTSSGIFLNEGNLTITEKSKENTLKVSGDVSGISCTSGGIKIEGGTISATGTKAGIEGKDITINGGTIAAYGGGSIVFDGGVIWGISSNGKVSITGGTINGVDRSDNGVHLSYNSVDPSEIELIEDHERFVGPDGHEVVLDFDKELSDDTASKAATSEKTTPNTGGVVENNLLLTYISLGLIAIAAIVIERKRLA